MLPRPTIEAFDRHLLGLGLMGAIQRPTRDFDILVPELPRAIASAARDFAKAQRQAGVDLQDDWLNNGPMQLGEVLPAEWRERVQRIFDGQALMLATLGRYDLLKSKLFALCARGTDLPDCIALASTAEAASAVLRRDVLVLDHPGSRWDRWDRISRVSVAAGCSTHDAHLR